MTRLQDRLFALGFGRFKRFRRWVGGRWVERYVEPTPPLGGPARWRWEWDPAARFDDDTHAIEQWPTRLPEARARRSK